MGELASSDLQRIVQLRFRPLWLYVDAVREFCGFFARATFKDSRAGERVSLVVHELVENAIRYGDDDELELEVERSERGVVIVVANTATDQAAEDLARIFERMRGVDPAACYLDAMRNAVQRPAGMSGLGLPRVRLEGRVELSLDRVEGRVIVTARGDL